MKQAGSPSQYQQLRRPLRVGLTGGIGSGKTTVSQLFELLGIPVFYADQAAKRLMDEDPALRQGISGLLGPEVYQQGKLDRAMVAKVAFGNPALLASLNALVHPFAVAAADQWMAQQQSPYVIKEAAIFFESGTQDTVDLMIGVTAPEEVRIGRVKTRSNLSREDILARMAAQMNDAEKMARCDYVINNDGYAPVIPQVLVIDERLRQLF